MSAIQQFTKVARNRNAMLLFLASIASLFGDWFYFTAIVSLVYDYGGPGAVATLTIFRQVPAILLAPVAGVFADRFARRALMIGTDFFRMACMFVLAVLAAFSTGSVGMILVLILASVLAGQLFRAARTSFLPTLVDKDHLMAMNSLDGLVATTALMVAPAIGALVIIVASREWLLVFNGVSFLVSAFLLFLVRTPESEAASRKRQIGYSEWWQGVRHIAGNSQMLATTMIYTSSHVAVGATWVFLAGLSKDVLGLGDEGVGYLTSVIGVGSVLGMLAGGILGRKNKELAASLGVGLLGVATVLCAWSSTAFVAFLAVGLMGLFANIAEPSVWTILQEKTPQDLYGRVFSAVDAISIGGLALGTAMAGGIINWLGFETGVSVVGLVTAAGALAFMPLLLRRPALTGSPMPTEETDKEGSAGLF